jgi:phosphocarrier protein
MRTESIEIINKLGLHARAAAKFSTLASQFECQIQVEHLGRVVNGKSIMGLMMLAAARGMTIEIRADGEDEHAAMEALNQLIAQRFGEPE